MGLTDLGLPEGVTLEEFTQSLTEAERFVKDMLRKEKEQQEPSPEPTSGRG